MDTIKKISITFLLALAATCFFFGVPKDAQAQGLNIPPVEMKEYRGPGYACSIKRYAGQPDEFQLIGSKKDFIHSNVVEVCLENLKRKQFVFVQETNRSTDSLKIAYTENMSCLHVVPTGSSTLWQINFNFWAGTGKQAEIEECLDRLKTAPDRSVTPPYQGNPTKRKQEGVA